MGRSWSDLFRFGYHRIQTEFSKNETASSKDYHQIDLVINEEEFKKDVVTAAKLSGLFPDKIYQN